MQTPGHAAYNHGDRCGSPREPGEPRSGCIGEGRQTAILDTIPQLLLSLVRAQVAGHFKFKPVRFKAHFSEIPFVSETACAPTFCERDSIEMPRCLGRCSKRHQFPRRKD